MQIHILHLLASRRSIQIKEILQNKNLGLDFTIFLIKFVVSKLLQDLLDVKFSFVTHVRTFTEIFPFTKTWTEISF